MPLSEVFLSMLVASGFASLAGLLAVLYKSKCISVKCCSKTIAGWSCFEIIRDVQGEEKIDEEVLHMREGNNPTPMSSV